MIRLYAQYLKEAGFCNCGTPRATLEWLGKAMTLYNEKSPDTGRFSDEFETWWDDYKKRQTAFFGSDNCYMFFCYWLNNKGFAEHGGSVGGGWLTAWGEDWLAKLPEALADYDAADAEAVAQNSDDAVDPLGEVQPRIKWINLDG